MNKTNNYFERNQIVRNAQNYRYNFIDYLYYQGRRYVHDKLFRLEHGIVVLGEHCLLSGYFSFLSPIYRYE